MTQVREAAWIQHISRKISQGLCQQPSCPSRCVHILLCFPMPHPHSGIRDAGFLHLPLTIDSSLLGSFYLLFGQLPHQGPPTRSIWMGPFPPARARGVLPEPGHLCPSLGMALRGAEGHSGWAEVLTQSAPPCQGGTDGTRSCLSNDRWRQGISQSHQSRPELPFRLPLSLEIQELSCHERNNWY